MSKARSYKTSDLKKLFALSGNNCAMPDCSKRLVSKDGNTVIGKICHIEAASENGPRWNSKMEDDDRRDFANLILMCSDHHDEIDEVVNLKKYSVSVLKKMKEGHESGNISFPFEVKEEHLNQLFNQLELISEIVQDTNVVVKQSANVLETLESKGDKMFHIMKQIQIDLAQMKEQGNFPNDKREIDSFVNKTLDFDYNWVDSDKMKAFQNILTNYNETILDRRKKFIFSQNIIQSMFNISDLKDITDEWQKNSWTPENLDHLRFIQGGIMAYSSLQQIPKDILNDFRLLNWSPIHHAYFVGHLGSFIKELKVMIELKVDLVKKYKNDRYLFENLNRIFNSLKQFLEFDVNELYFEKELALIIKRLPKQFLLLNTASEITIRDVVDFDNVLARLPLNKQFRVFKIEVIKKKNEILIIGYQAHECFYWNPTEDITSKIFYYSKENERITDLICELNPSGSINCTVQIGKKIIQFEDFQEKQKYNLENQLQLIAYSGGFVGIKNNYVNSQGGLLYSIKDDFTVENLLTIEDLNKKVKQDESISNWLKGSDSEVDNSILETLSNLQNLTAQKIIYQEKDILLIKGSILKTSILILLSIDGKYINYHNIIHLKESTTIAINSHNYSNNLELVCGYLDLARKDSVFEHINFIDFKYIESKTITRERKGNLNCRDIYSICFGSEDDIYLIEEGNSIMKYSILKNEFFEYLRPNNNTINDIKFIKLN